MKRKIVMMAAMVLSIGCMTVPVAASENVAVPAEIAAEAYATAVDCPNCDEVGKIIDQIITQWSIENVQYMVFILIMNGTKCNTLK